jgi:hypothetical protein
MRLALCFPLTCRPAAPRGNEPKRRDSTRLPRAGRLCASAKPIRQYPALLGCGSRLTRSRTHIDRCGSPSSQRGGECRQVACDRGRRRRRLQRTCLEACDWVNYDALHVGCFAGTTGNCGCSSGDRMAPQDVAMSGTSFPRVW